GLVVEADLHGPLDVPDACLGEVAYDRGRPAIPAPPGPAVAVRAEPVVARDQASRNLRNRASRVSPFRAPRPSTLFPGARGSSPVRARGVLWLRLQCASGCSATRTRTTRR